MLILEEESAGAATPLPELWVGRAIPAGAGALFVGAVLAVQIAGFVELARDAPAPPDGPGVGLLIVPWLVCFGLPFALMGSLLVVLPTASAARWASVRFTGRDLWWWVPVVAVSLATAVAAVCGAVLGSGPAAVVWSAGAPVLTGAALLARSAALHGGRLLRILGYGTLTVVAVFAVGAAVFATGLATEYRPPKVDTTRLAGTWSDGGGGTLRLAPDGTATADTLGDYDSWVENGAAEGSGKGHCSGHGTWRYEPGTSTTWDQSVRLDIDGCSYGADAPEDGWRISGTADRPKLSREYGDVDDAPHWYTLTR